MGGGKLEAESSITWGNQVIILERGIGVMEGISGRLGNLPWGCRHQGRLLGCLRGPTSWNLPTHTVGISSRDGGDGGSRVLPLPFPNHVDRPPSHLSMF